MLATEVTYVLADQRGGEISSLDLAALSKSYIEAANKIGIDVVHGGAELIDLALVDSERVEG